MKMLIIDPCMVNYHDDRGGVAADRGDLVDVAKGDARSLAELGRALFADKKDDYNPDGRYTADKELLAAAEKARKSAKSDA